MSDLFIGLMSGTSLDGIDAALVDFTEGKSQLLDFCYLAFSEQLKAKIQAISLAKQKVSLLDYGSLDCELGDLFAVAVLSLLAKSGVNSKAITAIGSHGQTVYHAPEAGFTLQIGDPNRIAQITGITTIADFRRADLAVGGQGAPLVPAFHQAVFADIAQARVVVNIGGIANITILKGMEVLGFDTGPGNTLLDHWCQTHRQLAYDKNGEWAATGVVQNKLLQTMTSDHYFAIAPPKSTGKEYFSVNWLQDILKNSVEYRPEDVQATLSKLTADSIAIAISRYAPDTTSTFICGGGAHNQLMMRHLSDNLGYQAQSTLSLGIHPDHVEAMAFAWLAKQTLNHLPSNLPKVTGARQSVILGSIYPVIQRLNSSLNKL